MISVLPHTSYIHDTVMVFSEELENIVCGVACFEEYFFKSGERFVNTISVFSFDCFFAFFWVLHILQLEITAYLDIFSPLELLPC